MDDNLTEEEYRVLTRRILSSAGEALVARQYDQAKEILARAVRFLDILSKMKSQ
jgi:hypothetical protein